MVTIKVGEKEKHVVEFFYSTFWGKAKVMVDGVELKQSIKLFFGKHKFSFEVGENEKHQVSIELNNRLGFAFRGSIATISIDGQVTQTTKIGGTLKDIILLSIYAILGAIVGYYLVVLLR